MFAAYLKKSPRSSILKTPGSSALYGRNLELLWYILHLFYTLPFVEKIDSITI